MNPRSEVLNIDCLEYMRGLPDKAFALAIADPPYGIGAELHKLHQGENINEKVNKTK